MKKKKVLLAIFIVLSMALTACQQNPGTTKIPGVEYEIGDTGGLELPLTENNEQVKMLVTSDVQDVSSKLIIERFREITGVDIQFEILSYGTAGTSGREKLSTMIAAKNMPDIMGVSLTESMAADLAMQGALAPIDEYLDMLPNVRTIFVDNKENDWVFKSYAAPDGKLYGVPRYDHNRDVNHGVLYRKDIFDKNNIKMWNSPDTFYNVLKQLKEIYPESSPFASKTQKMLFSQWSASWGMDATKPYYDEAAKVWKFTDTDPVYKDMLSFIKKLYDEKLIDPEFLTMTESAWTAKMTKEDQAFLTFDWIGRLDQFVQIASQTVPGYDLRYGNPIGPKQTLRTLPKINGGMAYVTRNKNTELAYKMLDFLVSPAGAELVTMGIKGETYEFDENNKINYFEFPEGTKAEIKDLENKYGMFLEGMYMRFDRRSGYYQFTEREQEAQEYAKDPKNMEPTDPILVFTGEEKEEIVGINTNLIKACEEFSTKYILTDGAGDAEWNEWLKQANGLGSDRLIELYNIAQKRYDGQ